MCLYVYLAEECLTNDTDAMGERVCVCVADSDWSDLVLVSLGMVHGSIC